MGPRTPPGPRPGPQCSLRGRWQAFSSLGRREPGGAAAGRRGSPRLWLPGQNSCGKAHLPSGLGLTLQLEGQLPACSLTLASHRCQSPAQFPGQYTPGSGPTVLQGQSSCHGVQPSQLLCAGERNTVTGLGRVCSWRSHL